MLKWILGNGTESWSSTCSTVQPNFNNWIQKCFARNYISELPLVFVFGIATSVSAVHRLLPNAVSSMLCMEKFQAPPSTEYLNMVINQVRHSSNLPSKMYIQHCTDFTDSGTAHPKLDLMFKSQKFDFLKIFHFFSWYILIDINDLFLPLQTGGQSLSTTTGHIPVPRFLSAELHQGTASKFWKVNELQPTVSF